MQSRSACRTVTVALASARPMCMGSTSMSSAWSMAPPRAKTVWTDLTSLVRSTDDPATMVWASSWPPNTTPPNPVSKFWARNRPSPVGSRSRTLRNPDGSDISASPRWARVARGPVPPASPSPATIWAPSARGSWHRRPPPARGLTWRRCPPHPCRRAPMPGRSRRPGRGRCRSGGCTWKRPSSPV